MSLLFYGLLQAILFLQVLSQPLSCVGCGDDRSVLAENTSGVSSYSLPDDQSTPEGTFEPTTEVPTTEVPTTEAPTSLPLPPITQPPTFPPTLSPTTQAPTTQAPTAHAPTTQAPTAHAPTTQAPTTQPPTTQAPTTQPPPTFPPTTLPPTPPPTCPATTQLPEGPLNAVMSAFCGYQEVGDKTYKCERVDTHAEWKLIESTCTPSTPAIGKVFISFRIRFNGIIISPYRSIILIIRTLLSNLLGIHMKYVIVSTYVDSVRRLDDSVELDVRISADADDTKLIKKASSLTIASLLEEGMDYEPSVFSSSSSASFVDLPHVVKDANTCETDFTLMLFEKAKDGVNCTVRVSDALKRRDGLVLIDKLFVSARYCLNAGYYYVECAGATTVTVTNKYDSSSTSLKLTSKPFGDMFKVEKGGEHISVPGSSKGEFDKSKTLTGKEAYPADPTGKTDFSCDETGYKAYLDMWKDKKTVPSDEFAKRLEYFKKACKKIHKRSRINQYPLAFTFYADWAPEEFEEITASVVEYKGVQPETEVIPIINNTNYRYLMPSMDPCDGNGELRELISKPQNCSVSWAFAITNSIEYAIKKMYFEHYDQIVEVSLSAQELIDCVGVDPDDPTNAEKYDEYYDEKKGGCAGFSLASGFEYVRSNGIAFSEYYPGGHTNRKGVCRMSSTTSDQRYYINGYEKPVTYNKLGLFKLMKEGPVAVTMGLSTEFFQYYRSDSYKGLYFDASSNKPSVYGVVMEYSQFAADGTNQLSRKPYFAVETRLRGCDSMVFRLPILETIENANVGGIAGLAIRPIVSELLPTPEPPKEEPTVAPTTLPPLDIKPDGFYPETIESITTKKSYYYGDFILRGLPKLKEIRTGNYFYQDSPVVSMTCR